MHFPKISRNRPSVGSTEGGTSAASEAPASNRPSAPPRARPHSTAPQAPRNTASADRPSTGTSKLHAFKKMFTPAETVKEWASQGGPGEHRNIAAKLIKAAKDCDKEELFYERHDCDLTGLNLKTLPVESLLRLHTDVVVTLDLGKLSNETIDALTAGIAKKGYHYSGPTFEPSLKDETQKRSQQAARPSQSRQEQAPRSSRPQQEQVPRPSRPGQEESAREVPPRRPVPAAIQVADLASIDGPAKAVQSLIDKGFSRAQLRDLHFDIREYGNHGDLNNGPDWFQKKYGAVFDQPISEAGAPRNYAKLLTQLLNA